MSVMTQNEFVELICRGLSIARKRGEYIDLIPLKCRLDNNMYETLSILNNYIYKCTKAETEIYFGNKSKYIDLIYSDDFGDDSLDRLKNELAIQELANYNINVKYNNYAEAVDNVKEIAQEISKKYKKYNQKETMPLEEIMSKEIEEEVFPFFSNGLNMTLKGIAKGEMYGIVCASGAGKSTYLSQEVKHIIKSGKKCCYIYTEMKQKDVFKNILTTLAGVNRRTTGSQSITEETWETFKSMVDIRRVDPEDLITPDVVKNIMLDTEADIILLDYLKIPGTGEGNVDSARVQGFLEVIKSTCEHNDKAFVFAMQATKSYFTLEERMRATEFTANSRRAHYVCDGFMCIAPIGDEDDVIDERHGVGVSRSNIRSINIAKNRQRRVNGKGYEGYFIYEEFDPEYQRTRTMGIKYLNGKALEESTEFENEVIEQFDWSKKEEKREKEVGVLEYDENNW